MTGSSKITYGVTYTHTLHTDPLSLARVCIDCSGLPHIPLVSTQVTNAERPRWYHTTYLAGHGSKQGVLHLHGFQCDNVGPFLHRLSWLTRDALYHSRHWGSQYVGLAFLWCVCVCVCMYLCKHMYVVPTATATRTTSHALNLY